jgi:hypothetical protein
MAVRPLSHPPSPFVAPTGGSIEVRLAAIAQEINKKADAGGAGPSWAFLPLRDATGQTWRLYVDATGALHTELVPR